MQGLLVNLTNPKAVVFMAAVTPQFIDPTRPQWLQFVIIGATMRGVDSVEYVRLRAAGLAVTGLVERPAGTTSAEPLFRRGICWGGRLARRFG